MESLPIVTLRGGEAERIVAGHPWIYQGAIARVKGQALPEDGAVVMVKDHKQRVLGCGFFNGRSKIHVRMLSHRVEVIDRAFFKARIERAIALRALELPGATSYRVVNAEGDLLSGLIVDKYEDVLVMQTSSLGMDRRKADILSVLEELLKPRAIFERNDAAFRKFEGLENSQGLISGEAVSPVPVRMNGLEFEADLAEGHKTGLYLDQQVNYRLVADLLSQRSAGKMLDAFTFQGGFALHAARAGVGQVLGLDQSEDCVAMAKRLAEQNGLSGRCRFEGANVFDWLKVKTARREGERLEPEYDAVVLDPPSFTRTRAAVGDALRGYKEIHLRAMKLVKPGGILATFCCSHHVDAGTFLDVILSAAFDARKLLRRVAVYGQSPDHPVIPSIPETEYLKGYAFEVMR
jgi:23S rRNA (cytosine1962-C5)-methyltransferase